MQYRSVMFIFAKRHIQSNISRRTHSRKFRTQITSAPFLTVLNDSRPRVGACLVGLYSKIDFKKVIWPTAVTNIRALKVAGVSLCIVRWLFISFAIPSYLGDVPFATRNKTFASSCRTIQKWYTLFTLYGIVYFTQAP